MTAADVPRKLKAGEAVRIPQRYLSFALASIKQLAPEMQVSVKVRNGTCTLTEDSHDKT